MNHPKKEHHGPYYRMIGQKYYQKGYADGYKRFRTNKKQIEQNDNTKYMHIVGLLLVIFMLFILIVGYMHNPRRHPHIMNSNNRDNCLLDLATTYHTECLD